MARREPIHVTIDEIWLDCSVRETHTLSADVTEHPVETGADVADHIRPRARTVSIEGLISNTPIEVPQSHMDGASEDRSPIEIEGEPVFGNVDTPVGEVTIPGAGQLKSLAAVVGIKLGGKRELQAQALHFTQEFDRVGAAHLDLESIILTSKRITIVTGLTIYENVAITDLQTTRDGGTGNALRFTATGRELRIVSSDTVDLPDPVDPRAKKTRPRGKQLTSEAAQGEGGRVKSALAAMAGL